MQQPEVVQVRSKPLTVGQKCAWAAVGMWVVAELGLWDWIRALSGPGLWATVYVTVMLGFAVRALHDAAMYLFAAAEALREKREFEAMGLSAAVEWARQKEIHDALTAPLAKVKPQWKNKFQRTGQDAEKWKAPLKES